MKQTEILTRVTHVNGWEPAVYMSYTSQNFRLFHVSNLSVRNFRIFLLMYPGSMTPRYAADSPTALRANRERRSRSTAGAEIWPPPSAGRRRGASAARVTPDNTGDTPGDTGDTSGDPDCTS